MLITSVLNNRSKNLEDIGSIIVRRTKGFTVKYNVAYQETTVLLYQIIGWF